MLFIHLCWQSWTQINHIAKLPKCLFILEKAYPNQGLSMSKHPVPSPN
jgi:hypothetical protein